MKKRIITASVLLVLVLVSIWFLPPLIFAMLSGVLFLVAAWEWTYIAKITSLRTRVLYLAGLVVMFFILYFALIPYAILLILNLIIAAWALLAIIRYGLDRGSAYVNYFWAKWLIGWVLFSSTWLSINLLRLTPFAPFWLFLGFLMIWAADIGAYFAGRFFGKHKLAVRLSPKKTWEGCWGGLFLACVLSLLIVKLSGVLFISLAAFGWIAVFVVIFSIIGDLFESLFKREAQLKDSGNILPGHGGVLDRIDSLLFAMPLYALISFTLFYY